MSRIGRLPIPVPAGVTVTIDDQNLVTVKGPKATLSQQVNSAITVKQEGNVLTLTELAEGNEQFYKGLSATPYVLNEDGTAVPQS